jgi:hypothetical protein
LPESRGEENGELLFSEYKSLSFVRWKSSGDLSQLCEYT